MEILNDTAENLMASIEKGEHEVSPSQLYAVASILEGVPYVNGAPQNTFVPGLIELAVRSASKPCNISCEVVALVIHPTSVTITAFELRLCFCAVAPAVLPSAYFCHPQQVEKGVLIGGDDFKSGQTKMKSVLVDFLVGAGIKPTSIVSYNHLGNNDGKNLSAPQTFRSKVRPKVQANQSACTRSWVHTCRALWCRLRSRCVVC